MSNIADYQEGSAYIILYKSQFKNEEAFYSRLKRLGIEEPSSKSVCFIKVSRNSCWNTSDDARKQKCIKLYSNMFKHKEYFQDLCKFLLLPENSRQLYIAIDGGYNAR